MFSRSIEIEHWVKMGYKFSVAPDRFVICSQKRVSDLLKSFKPTKMTNEGTYSKLRPLSSKQEMLHGSVKAYEPLRNYLLRF